MTLAAKRGTLKVADEVWIVTALLHHEQPWRAGFRHGEILDRAARENLAGTLRPGVTAHISFDGIANRPPNPGRYRILYKLPNGERRLFRQGDDYHPNREGGKVRPEKDDIPRRFHELIDWYDREYAPELRVSRSLRGALKPRPAQPIRDWAAARESVERAIAADSVESEN
ncbi:MAG: hypothetical protein HY334_03510 [Armatimonadetes bacterium]|nr:hypothetical protein [Armatimonadota bacterium]